MKKILSLYHHKNQFQNLQQISRTSTKIQWYFTGYNSAWFSRREEQWEEKPTKNSSTRAFMKQYFHCTTIKIDSRTFDKFQETPRENSMIFHWMQLRLIFTKRRAMRRETNTPAKERFRPTTEKTRGRNPFGGTTRKWGRGAGCTIGELNSPFHAVRDGSWRREEENGQIELDQRVSRARRAPRASHVELRIYSRKFPLKQPAGGEGADFRSRSANAWIHFLPPPPPKTK